MRTMTLLGVLLGATATSALAQFDYSRFKVTPSTERATVRLSDEALQRVGRPVEFGRGHLLVQFENPPTAQQREELRNRGVEVLSDLPENGLLVSLSRDVDLGGLGLLAAEPLPAAVKLSSMILPGSGDDFVVEFHPDVEMNLARAIVLRAGLQLAENPDVGPQRLLVRKRLRARVADALDRLLQQDEVAYVFPASEELVRGIPVVPCSSALSETGILAQYIATVGNGWDGAGLGAAALQYVWGSPTTKLIATQAQGEILRAMQEWSRVAAISWAQGVNASAAKTVHVVFSARNHGDGYPFDGPGNVLAHTFYPAAPNPEPLAGDMHLDDSEGWRVGANVDLYSVALHELGHALGLGHSDDPRAVMYPYYRMATTLQADDRAAILRLYAAAGTTAPAPPTPSPTPTPTPTPPSPAPSDRTAPSLSILNPGTSMITTSAASRLISGTAQDAGGLRSVTWVNSLGGSGTAAGTASWSATIPLTRGINRITVTATDNSGNYAWRTIVITRP